MNLLLIISLLVLCHAALNGMRIAVSLFALSHGGSALIVGTLMSLTAIFPMLLGVASGRWTDRIGARRPILLGASAVLTGALIPAFFPGIPALFVTSVLIGTGFMAAQVSMQNAVGALSEPHERARNFGKMSVGMSMSAFTGPLIAGLGIDHLGYQPAFAILAIFPLIAIMLLWRGRIKLPPPSPHAGQHLDRSVLDLLRKRELLRLFVVSTLLAMGWDLHSFFVPIFGTKLGLSASEIGVVLATFGTATFVIRLAMRWIAGRYTEWRVLTSVMFLAGATYLLFPFAAATWQLMILSFALGLALGAAQPMVMALMHHATPLGRAGEAIGLRTTLINSSSVALPLVFGAVGAAVGLTPVFWTAAICLCTGGYLTRR
ncbi:MAG: MFS transporter [Betaproteobacteria bacterium]